MLKRILYFVLVIFSLTACGFKRFEQSDVIDIRGNIYVITTIPIDGALTIEKRHVPNPDTLDALGISRGVIDNKGRSNAELEEIPLGLDIPDVNRDKAGFDAFKAKYFPNTIPIKPGGTGSTETPVGTWLKIVSPISGQFAPAQTILITWESSKNIDTVSIMIKVDRHHGNWVIFSQPNTGKYLWNINIGNTTNTRFYIEITGYETNVDSVTSAGGYFEVKK